MQRPLRALLFIPLLVWIGCALPEREQWPRLVVLVDPAAAALIKGEGLARFEQMDGTRIELRIEPPLELARLLAAAEPADLLLTSDDELWQQAAEQDWLAEPPWRFELERRQVIILAPEAARPWDLTQLLMAGPLAIEDAQLSREGATARQALVAAGLWDRVRPLHAPSPAAAMAAVTEGRAAAAALVEEPAGAVPPGWRLAARLDPYPHMPTSLAGAVLAAPRLPRESRRAWNYLEKLARAGIAH